MCCSRPCTLLLWRNYSIGQLGTMGWLQQGECTSTTGGGHLLGRRASRADGNRTSMQCPACSSLCKLPYDACMFACRLELRHLHPAAAVYRTAWRLSELASSASKPKPASLAGAMAGWLQPLEAARAAIRGLAADGHDGGSSGSVGAGPPSPGLVLAWGALDALRCAVSGGLGVMQQAAGHDAGEVK